VDRAPLIRLDAFDKVVFANEAWLELAREMWRSSLSEAGVLGRSFSDLAPDPELGPAYRLVFRKTRETGRPARIPLRFEASTRCWHVDVHVQLLANGELECRYYSLLVEVPGTDLVTQCTWCRRRRLPEGRWVSASDMLERIDLFLGNAPRVTHGICPSCSASWAPALESSE
jgi:hypothetical protein